MKKYLEANQETGKQFYMDFHGKGKVVMLNLLKFKDTADYSNLASIEPETTITGKEAYAMYMERTLPHLEKAGSKVLFYGDSHHFLIGPASEGWDAVLLVEHVSVESFIAFAQNTEYLKTAGHRTAALEDSRLLPSSEVKTS